MTRWTNGGTRPRPRYRPVPRSAAARRFEEARRREKREERLIAATVMAAFVGLVVFTVILILLGLPA